VTELVFVEGQDAAIEVSLQKNVIASGGISGRVVEAVEDIKKPSALIQIPPTGGVLLKLGLQPPLVDKSRCRIIISDVSASPLPEDKKEFMLSGFLTVTKHCSGTYKVSSSLDFTREVSVSGKGRVYFTLGPYISSSGNAVGGLLCPKLSAQEEPPSYFDPEYEQWNGISVDVPFRLPILACNDPEKCPYGAYNEKTGKKGTACDRYFKSDCGASSREQSCEFEQELPACTNPLNGGAPVGGGSGLLQQNIAQEVGKQCCFCGYDAKGEDSARQKEDCQTFFKKVTGSFKFDPSFKCEIAEEIPLPEWQQRVKELSAKHLCKMPLAIQIEAHGTSSSKYYKYDQYTPNNQFITTCRNLREVTRMCVGPYPDHTIDIYANSCEVFQNNDPDIEKYATHVQTFLGEDQVVSWTSNILYGFMTSPGKTRETADENVCTLQKTVTISPSCISVKLQPCRKESTLCGPAYGISYACLDANGVQTTQMCCKHSIFNSKFGVFSKPGSNSCSAPACTSEKEACTFSDYISLSNFEKEEGGECTMKSYVDNKPISKKTTQACCPIKVNGNYEYITSETGKLCPSSCDTTFHKGCLINGKTSTAEKGAFSCTYDSAARGASCDYSSFCDGKGACKPASAYSCTNNSDCPFAGSLCDGAQYHSYGCVEGFCKLTQTVGCSFDKEICKQTTPTTAECVPDIKPCRKEGEYCSVRDGSRACIAENGVQTTQKCCPSVAFSDYGFTAKLGVNECPAPSCARVNAECVGVENVAAINREGYECALQVYSSSELENKLIRQQCCATMINGNQKILASEPGKSCPSSCASTFNSGCLINGKTSTAENGALSCTYDSAARGTYCKDQGYAFCDGAGECKPVFSYPCTQDSDCPFAGSLCSYNRAETYACQNKECSFIKSENCYSTDRICKQVTPTKAECVKA
jgi:hypothetical protein